MKVVYEIDLANARSEPSGHPASVRRLGQDDQAALAGLMLDAYVGTVDYDDETLDDAHDEVGRWLQTAPMLDHSLGAERDGRLASAVLVSELDGTPFVSYVMTDRGHKRTGLARILVRACLQSLRSAGEQRVVLAITRGNVASERLFVGLGARPVHP